ncbi:MAG: aminotransferase class I and II [Patulibacter sp.]
METHRVTRYVTALREGGSLPGLVEADDDGLYVLKLRGAGQGLRALVSEVVVGELARALGLRVPPIALLELDPAIGRAEPDPDIQDLLKASAGLNVGLDFLPAALPYAVHAGHPLAVEEAAAIVWLDLLTTNVDRTPRNTNMLWWHQHVWLIDHGAALYRQHAATLGPGEADRPFPQIADHVLLPLLGATPQVRRDALLAAHERLAPQLTEQLLTAIAGELPEGWAGEHDYAGYLRERAVVVGRQLAASPGFEVTGSASTGPGTGGLPRGPEAGRGLGPRVGAPRPPAAGEQPDG